MSPRRSAFRATLLGLVVLAGSCTSSTEPATATSISLSTSTVSFTALGATQMITATVLDQRGKAMQDENVIWTTNAAGVATVTPGGVVTAVGAGAAIVTASRGTLSATANVSVTQTPASMLVAPGNTADGSQSAAGQPVSVKPAVQVRDANGNGINGIPVTFAVASGNGSVLGGNAVTNAAGLATVGSWILGPDLGPQSLTASFGALSPVTFTVTAIEDVCSFAGATPLTVGTPANGLLNGSDCQLGTGQNFELYRFELAAQTSMVLSLSSAQFDAYLTLFDAQTGTQLAENDDIVTFVQTDSRIAITLPAGAYILRARSYDPGESGGFTILARAAILGAPAIITMQGGNGQVAAPGATVGIAPSVRVTDEALAPVAGTTVTFATVPGFGSVTGASAVTDANGIATVGSWTLAAGANVLSATVGGGALNDPIVFSATGKASTGGFDIALRFVGVPTVNQLQTFSAAAARWESIISGDLPPQAVNLGAGNCGSPVPIAETVDDVVITVRLEAIDGVGAILGSAGPCFVRSSPSFLPAYGSMRFDTADLANLESSGSFGAVILHEMGHVLGIGTIWSTKGLLQNPSTATTANDTYFSGSAARTAFDQLAVGTYTGGQKVPVENRIDQAGVSYAGTRNSHWRETILGTELMTGFLNGGVANPLSLLTINSLADLGYTVDTGAADAFTFNVSLLGGLGTGGAGGGKLIRLEGDVRTEPVYELDRSGRPIGLPFAPSPLRKRPPRR